MEEENIISKEDFEFIHNKDEKIYDEKFKTKKISAFKDSLIRFSKNKGSIVAFFILMFLFLFSIIVPFVSGYKVSDSDSYYTNCTPRLFAGADGFWDGKHKVTTKENLYNYYYYYGAASEPISKVTEFDKDIGEEITMVTYKQDTYVVGFKYLQVNQEQLNKLVEYDAKISDDKGKILGYMLDYSYIDDLPYTSEQKDVLKSILARDPNYFYQIDRKQNPILKDNKIQDIYKKDENGNYVNYIQNKDSSGNFLNSYQIRVNYDNYYVYKNGKAPNFVLGSNNQGYDILTRVASGGRISLGLGFLVALINIAIGIIYGAIEGYYGGATDLIMERISDILSAVPLVVVISLFTIRFSNTPSFILLLIAFIATGWIGMASTTRMQFYRYKRQEYILAARTLGAKDGRLIFKHILPNAIGPLITSGILMIPSVIFSESMLSYLNIISLSGPERTSIGTMLSEGVSSFTTYPNNIIWPALFISLLMISFNIFGNGLRDAFNPSLRGSE